MSRQERLKKPRHISRIMSVLLDDMNIKEKMNNWQVVKKWHDIVGDKIAQHAQAVGVDTENLYVEVDNPTWQGQLFLMKNEILSKCRKHNVFLKDIKFHISGNKEA